MNCGMYLVAMQSTDAAGTAGWRQVAIACVALLLLLILLWFVVRGGSGDAPSYQPAHRPDPPRPARQARDVPKPSKPAPDGAWHAPVQYSPPPAPVWTPPPAIDAAPRKPVHEPDRVRRAPKPASSTKPAMSPTPAVCRNRLSRD
jgi:hypothetical protein